jgi:sec-independent protein translocase protein TatC
MVTETEEPRTEYQEEQEEEGGPVKSFLEHLEDLRWVLIKIAAVVGVAMLLCLIAGDKVVKIVEGPLDKAKVRFPSSLQVVTFFFGENKLWTLQIDTKKQPFFPLSTNRFVSVQVVPVAVEAAGGSNQVLGLRVDTNSAPEMFQKLHVDIVNLSPTGAFLVAFQVAFYGGLALASPFVFYFIAQFVFPALKMKEKKYVYRGLFFGAGLFATGVCFCYFALMPVALAASVQYSSWLGFSANQWRAEDYIGFVCKFMLGMGLGFELPVVILTLVKIGVLNYGILSKARRYMIVINLILGALLTTPEVITQILMALPLQLLYEISVWITWYWERRDRKRAARAEQAAA